jgi:ergothioneine biosynthesis protein EgtB
MLPAPEAKLPVDAPFHNGYPPPMTTGAPPPSPTLAERYVDVRSRTKSLAAPLSAEDQCVQSMPDASPTKWHLAHTTWFFETFLLQERRGYAPFDPSYGYLFNSYYEAVGSRHPRPERGLLTRPPLDEVHAYRDHVDRAMLSLLSSGDLPSEARAVAVLGVAHEEQHQELILTDVLHLLGKHPSSPAYVPGEARTSEAPPLRFVDQGEGLFTLGHAGDGFAFDNEGPAHRTFVEAFSLATRAVTNAEYQAFIEDGGYTRPELWLSDGFAHARAEGWSAPLHWRAVEGGFEAFTLRGLLPLDPGAPVSHVSFYEADAYARWANARLPSEAEWELFAAKHPVAGNFASSGELRPSVASSTGGMSQLFGDVWEWTASPYVAYPRYRPPAGALGEYNGKFMCNQMVLRGGSCLTPEGHVRASYRNFFPPSARWQMSGIRLARDP